MIGQSKLEHAFCVIGAGPAGICAAKHLDEHGLPFEVIEREDDVGGTWYFGRSSCRVYESVHLITSKALTEYTDYPMPSIWPDFPNRRLAQEYLRSYVEHFHLRKHFRFSTNVLDVTPANDGEWDVHLEGGEVRRYRGVIVASGHLWDPVYPTYPGVFNGTTVHAAHYRNSDLLRDRRVLVIGAGNSGCDIVVEAAQVAQRAVHSTRREFYCVPKYIFGRPVDQIEEALLKLRFPSHVTRFVDWAVHNAVAGDLADHASIEEQKHLVHSSFDKFEQSIVFNDLLPHYIRHGDVVSKPDVMVYDGSDVVFTDQTRESFDTVIYATGYRISYPFVGDSILNMRYGQPSLYLHIFPPAFDNLFFVGLAHPNGGIWQMVERQCRLIMAYVGAKSKNRPAAIKFDSLRRQHGKQRLQSNPPQGSALRYHIGVERHSYSLELDRLMRRLLK